MNPSVVVFDIGGVLVDWKPHLAWSPELGSDEAALEFMERIGFADRNKRADGGERFADLAADIADAEDRRRLEDYVRFYSRTVVDPVPGTWDVVDRLLAKEVPLHAITNWSAETWSEGVKVHPRLGEVFGTIVVSGEEGFQKPDPRIFACLCDRAKVSADACVFIDDSLHNVEGAKAAGMDAIHFNDADALESELTRRGLL